MLYKYRNNIIETDIILDWVNKERLILLKMSNKDICELNF